MKSHFQDVSSLGGDGEASTSRGYEGRRTQFGILVYADRPGLQEPSAKRTLTRRDMRLPIFFRLMAGRVTRSDQNARKGRATKHGRHVACRTLLWAPRRGSWLTAAGSRVSCVTGPFPDPKGALLHGERVTREWTMIDRRRDSGGALDRGFHQLWMRSPFEFKCMVCEGSQ